MGSMIKVDVECRGVFGQVRFYQPLGFAKNTVTIYIPFIMEDVFSNLTNFAAHAFFTLAPTSS